MEHVVDVNHRGVGIGESRAERLVEPVEIALDRLVIEVLEALDHEVGRLEIVDHVVGTHHPVDVEHDPVGALRLDREYRLARAREDPGAIGPHVFAFEDQSELDRVPIERAQRLQAVVAHRLPPGAAIFLHVIGVHRVSQHRDVTEDIVEHVGLLDVVEGLAGADEITGREAAVGEVPEEHMVGNQHRNRHHRPAGQPAKFFRKAAEIRHAAAPKIELFEPG